MNIAIWRKVWSGFIYFLISTLLFQLILTKQTSSSSSLMLGTLMKYKLTGHINRIFPPDKNTFGITYIRKVLNRCLIRHTQHSFDNLRSCSHINLKETSKKSAEKTMVSLVFSRQTVERQISAIIQWFYFLEAVHLIALQSCCLKLLNLCTFASIVSIVNCF